MKFNRQMSERLFSGFILFVRVAIGYVFLWGSLPKIRQPYDFLSGVYSYELVGPKFGMLVAMTLPWLELLVGVCLVGGIFVGGALLASVGMAAMFTFVLSSALYQGLEISCGCFGASTEIIGYSTIIRAFLILIFSIMAYIGLVVQHIPHSIIHTFTRQCSTNNISLASEEKT